MRTVSTVPVLGPLCLLAAGLAGCGSQPPEPQRVHWEIGEKQAITNLSPDGRELIEAFDQARRDPRLLLIYSPT